MHLKLKYVSQYEYECAWGCVLVFVCVCVSVCLSVCECVSVLVCICVWVISAKEESYILDTCREKDFALWDKWVGKGWKSSFSAVRPWLIHLGQVSTVIFHQGTTGNCDLMKFDNNREAELMTEDILVAWISF